MLNRRKFVAASAASVAVGAGATVVPLAVAKQFTANSINSTTMRLGSLMRKDLFTALQGETFQLHNAVGQRLQARLLTVQDEGCCAELEQFSLRFQAEQDLPLTDATYTVQHAQAGQCELYLVPNESGQLTAMFSLLT